MLRAFPKKKEMATMGKCKSANMRSRNEAMKIGSLTGMRAKDKRVWENSCKEKSSAFEKAQ